MFLETMKHADHSIIFAASASQCSLIGEYFPDPADKCRYLRCVYDADVRYLVPESRPCNVGTSVDPSYVRGLTNPCIINDKQCVGGKKICTKFTHFLKTILCFLLMKKTIEIIIL